MKRSNKLKGIIVCILLLVLSIFSIFKKDPDYISTTAKIVNIVEEYDIVDEEYIYNVFVDYKAGGKNYTNVLYPAYDSKMNIGDEVEALYDPNNPSLIQSPGHKTVPYIVAGAALVSLIIFIFFA